MTRQVEIKTTTCYMCACRCGIRVHLRDGEVRYIDGNPEHPLNKGVICAKGASGIMKQHSPARLTRPLKRRAGAERGAAEFEPISWDEAFTLLGELPARHLPFRSHEAERPPDRLRRGALRSAVRCVEPHPVLNQGVFNAPTHPSCKLHIDLPVAMKNAHSPRGHSISPPRPPSSASA